MRPQYLAGFQTMEEKVADKEGIVILGAGGNLNQWIDGVSALLFDEGITKTKDADELWDSVYKLVTSGGRIDLVMVFKDGAEFQLGKMAMWRIQFGNCSWVSDYIVNYRDQFDALDEHEANMVLAFWTGHGSYASALEACKDARERGKFKQMSLKAMLELYNNWEED